MSIKTKIFLYTLFVILILTFSLGYYTFNFQKKTLMSHKIEDIKFFMEGFSIPIKEALISNEYSRINNIVNNLKYNIPINAINVYDENSNCIGSNNPHNLNSATKTSPVVKVFKDKSGVSTITKNEIVIVEPILVRNFLYGVLEIRLPISIIENIRKDFIRNTSIFFGIAIFLGIGFSLILANNISAKVGKIIQASKALASGDFRHKIDIESNDEFGYLASIFNKMIFNMKIMFNVIKKINFSTPSDELLEVIMDNIIMALGAERISILYFDEEENILKLNKVRGLGEEIIDVVSLRVGEGIAGKVFESGIPMIVNSGFSSMEFKKFENSSWRDEKIKNLMCVPVTVDKNIIGVINVINKKGGEGFDEFDLKLLQALVGHIASAISRATLYNETITDGLTGLYIKKYFFSRLEEEAYRAKRYGQALCVLFIDIDDFGALNSKLGSLECDIILMHLGRIIKNNIRLNVDIPTRFESDEMAVILPETDHAKAVFFGDRLREKISNFAFPLESGDTVNITVSIGVAQYDPAEDLSKMVKNLEEALKISKNKGKNRVTLYEKI